MACRTQSATTFTPEARALITRTPPPAKNLPCLEVSPEPGWKDIADDAALVSIGWEEGDFSPQPELTLLSEAKNLLIGFQRCTLTPNTLVFQVETSSIVGASMVIRDLERNRTALIDDLTLQPGKILHLGMVTSQSGSKISGRIEGELDGTISGKILELDKPISIQSDGQWSTGALPHGSWSIVIKNSQGQSLAWHSILLDEEEFKAGSAPLVRKTNFITPLWIGVLMRPFAPFAFSAEENYIEMRIADNSSFTNSYWVPLRSVFSWPVTGNGLQTVFVQFRTAERVVSETMTHQFRTELAGNLEFADATVVSPTLSMFVALDEHLKQGANASAATKKIETVIQTFPPAGAELHSVTVDVDDQPRVWLDLATPLSVSLPLSTRSCGQHQVYIRFKDADGRETPSLRRPWNIRCWDSEIPKSPLAPRYGHGAAAFKFCYNPETESNVSCEVAGSTQSHGVFIWGGRDESKLFSDGAVLRKFNSGWRWDLLPSNAALTGRVNPHVVAGNQNILIWGGENLEGNPVASGAFFRVPSHNWQDTLPGNAASAKLHSTAAFVKQINAADGLGLAGMFVIMGGETQNAQTGLPSPSDELAVLYETQGGLLGTNWARYSLGVFVSRAGFALDTSGRFLWIASGLGKPSTESGTDPELNSSLIALATGSQMVNGVTSSALYSYSYPSANSRIGSVYGHVLLLERYKVNSALTARGYLESTLPCVFGGQKYTDILPQVCEVFDVPTGQAKAYQPFCRRLYDSYNFAPVGRRTVCFRPSSVVVSGVTSYFSRNFFLPLQGAPSERRLLPKSSASFPDYSNPRLFVWSGLSAAGGEYLADGAIFEYTSNSWIPVTEFEAPIPRNFHTATALPDLKRVFIFGGLTATGATAHGGFYALP